MAKRFTDSEKWSHSWFRKLLPELKCVWFYLLDKCNHAGIWIADFEAVSFHVGKEITESDLIHFGEKLYKFDGDKYFITSFIDFQYGELNPENRAHKSVICILEKQGLYKVLRSPLKGAKDKDKDMVKDKVKGIKAEIEKIYLELYPLKEGKQKGIETLSKSVKTPEDLERLKYAIGKYKASIKDPKYIKHFSTFATSWTDWLDESAGQADLPQNSTSHDVSHIFERKEA